MRSGECCGVGVRDFQKVLLEYGEQMELFRKIPRTIGSDKGSDSEKATKESNAVSKARLCHPTPTIVQFYLIRKYGTLEYHHIQKT